MSLLGDTVLARKPDDLTLIHTFLEGEAALLSNQNLRVETTFEVSQLIARKEGIVATVKEKENVSCVSVRYKSQYWPLIHELLIESYFVPLNYSAQQGFMNYEKHQTPEGYQRNYTEAKLLWKEWWVHRLHYCENATDLDLLILVNDNWHSVQEIVSSYGTIHFHTSQGKVTIENSAKVTWLLRIQEEQAQHKPVSSRFALQNHELEPFVTSDNGFEPTQILPPTYQKIYQQPQQLESVIADRLESQDVQGLPTEMHQNQTVLEAIPELLTPTKSDLSELASESIAEPVLEPTMKLAAELDSDPDSAVSETPETDDFDELTEPVAEPSFEPDAGATEISEAGSLEDLPTEPVSELISEPVAEIDTNFDSVVAEMPEPYPWDEVLSEPVTELSVELDPGTAEPSEAGLLGDFLAELASGSITETVVDLDSHLDSVMAEIPETHTLEELLPEPVTELSLKLDSLTSELSEADSSEEFLAELASDPSAELASNIASNVSAVAAILETDSLDELLLESVGEATLELDFGLDFVILETSEIPSLPSLNELRLEAATELDFESDPVAPETASLNNPSLGSVPELELPQTVSLDDLPPNSVLEIDTASELELLEDFYFQNSTTEPLSNLVQVPELEFNPVVAEVPETEALDELLEPDLETNRSNELHELHELPLDLTATPLYESSLETSELEDSYCQSQDIERSEHQVSDRYESSDHNLPIEPDFNPNSLMETQQMREEEIVLPPSERVDEALTDEPYQIELLPEEPILHSKSDSYRTQTISIQTPVVADATQLFSSSGANINSILKFSQGQLYVRTGMGELIISGDNLTFCFNQS